MAFSFSTVLDEGYVGIVLKLKQKKKEKQKEKHPIFSHSSSTFYFKPFQTF